MEKTALPTKKLLLDKAGMNAALDSLATEIASEFSGAELDKLAVIGIQFRGVPFARRLASKIGALRGRKVRLGTLDITMYRDDIGMRKTLPVIHETDIPFDVDGSIIILADDVLQTGRSIRAALDAVNYFGRPAVIRLAVLMDRGLREYPIRADYVGSRTDLPKDRKVSVMWEENDGEDAVYESEKTNIKS